MKVTRITPPCRQCGHRVYCRLPISGDPCCLRCGDRWVAPVPQPEAPVFAPTLDCPPMSQEESVCFDAMRGLL